MNDARNEQPAALVNGLKAAMVEISYYSSVHAVGSLWCFMSEDQAKHALANLKGAFPGLEFPLDSQIAEWFERGLYAASQAIVPTYDRNAGTKEVHDRTNKAIEYLRGALSKRDVWVRREVLADVRGSLSDISDDHQFTKKQLLEVLKSRLGE